MRIDHTSNRTCESRSTSSALISYGHNNKYLFYSRTSSYKKSEIRSQSTRCQVQAGAYVSLLTPGGTKYFDCHPRENTTHILHVVSITTHTHDRHKSIGEKETKKRKKDKGKERKEKKNETRRKRRAKRKKSADCYVLLAAVGVLGIF